MMIKIALLGALLAVIAFIASGVAYSRRIEAGRTRDQRLNRQAYEAYQASLARNAAPADIDERWSQFWAECDEEYARSPLRAWLLRSDDPVDEVIESFALECDSVIERFVAAAMRRQRDLANTFAGWADDTAREADRWYTMAGGSLSALAHLVAIDITDTGSWTAADEAALRSHMAAQNAQAGARA